MNPNPQPYYTRKNLSAALLISESTIKRNEKTGALKATHLGPRLVRYRAEDVEAFLARRKQQEPPNTGKS
jgi:predicted DNA-binding transcriptional regulator AlpA